MDIDAPFPGGNEVRLYIDSCITYVQAFPLIHIPLIDHPWAVNHDALAVEHVVSPLTLKAKNIKFGLETTFCIVQS